MVQTKKNINKLTSTRILVNSDSKIILIKPLQCGS